MSIRNRILTLSAVLFGFLLLAIFVGLSQISRFDHNLHLLYEDRIVPLKDLKNISDSYAVNIVDTNHKLRNGNISWQEAQNNIVNAQKEINEIWKAYMATTLTDKEAQLAKRAEKLMYPANQAIDELLTLVRAQNAQEIEKFSIEKLYPVIDPISDAISQLINLQLDVAQEINQESSESYQTLMTLSIVAIILSFVFISWFVLVTVRAISRPLNELVETSQTVMQSGDFSQRVTITRMDEVGVAASAFNQLLNNTTQAIKEANQVVGAIAQSDFSQRMNGNYVGDLNQLKEGVNASAKSVSFMMDELGKIMQALQDGRFDAKMDPQVPEAFRQQVEKALSTIDQVVTQINDVMSHMNQGEFDKRIQTQAHGQLEQLKININGSMDSLETAVQDIRRVVTAQADGDLTTKITNHYEGELSVLKEVINGSAQKLTEVVSKALNASNVVHTASDEVSRGALDLSQRVQEQAAALEETSATMDEMNSTVQNNTENSKQATVVAQDMQQQAQQGQEIMAQTITAMNQIQESSHKISDIVSLIDGIAFQTNLLALNAAVEAARAGEHGRGFAVVAGEVRALAQKSADAAKDITSLINESVTRIDEGTKLASESGETLNTMTDSIEKVSHMIEQIAQASVEQAEGVNQVHKAITEIDKVTQQNAALVEETSAASESLSEQAQNLNNEMNFFNTGNAQVNQTNQSRASTPVVRPAPKIESKPAQKPASKPVPKPSVETAKPSTPSQNNEEWDEF